MKAGYVFTNFPYLSGRNEKKYLKCTSFVLVDKNYGPMIFDGGSVYDSLTLINFLKENFNLTPSDIQWVFTTHIHPDHIGANRFFKNAKLIISKKDYEFARDIANVVFEGGNLLEYLHKNCPGYRTSFSEFEAKRMKMQIEDKWSEKNVGINLNPCYIEDSPIIPDFIKIIPTPGHTFHHYSFLITTNNSKILVAGDALSMRLILRDNHEERLLEPHMDFDKYFNSLEIIKKYDCLIIPGHDRPFFIKSLKAIRKNYFLIDEITQKQSAV